MNTCKHWIGLLYFPYEAPGYIFDGDRSDASIATDGDNGQQKHIITFKFCPNCGKKLNIVQTITNDDCYIFKLSHIEP